MTETEALLHRQKRALFRATHRGTKEMDALLGRYIAHVVFDMSAPQLSQLEGFLALPDPVLDGWIMGRDAPQDASDLDMVRAIRSYHGLT